MLKTEMDVEDKPRPELPAAGTLGVTHEHHGQHNKERRVGQGRERDSDGCNEDNQTENNSKHTPAKEETGHKHKNTHSKHEHKDKNTAGQRQSRQRQDG